MKATVKYVAMTEKTINRIALDIPKRTEADLIKVRSLISAELERRNKTTKKVVVKRSKTLVEKAARENEESKEGTTPSFAKNGHPVLQNLKYEDRCRNIIRSKNYVMSVPGEIMYKKQRYCIVEAAKSFGGVKLTKGNKVYDAYSKMDKYILCLEFPTTEAAIQFMDGQHNYKRG